MSAAENGNTVRLTIAMTAYIGSIAAANYMTAHMGLVPVGFGLMVTAGTFAAGFALLARDFVHRYGGLWFVMAGITVGAVISVFMATPALAVASLAAFTLAEVLDLLVFSKLRKRGFARAVLASNTASAPIDTIVFLALAGFPITAPLVAGQLIGKLVWATLLPLAVYVGVRGAVLRQSVNAVGA